MFVGVKSNPIQSGVVYRAYCCWLACDVVPAQRDENAKTVGPGPAAVLSGHT